MKPWLSFISFVSHINNVINTAPWESLHSSPSHFPILYVVKYALQLRESFMSASRTIDFIPIKILLGFFHFSFYPSFSTFLRDCQLALGSKVSLKKKILYSVLIMFIMYTILLKHQVSAAYYLRLPIREGAFCPIIHQHASQKKLALALTSKSLSVLVLVSLPTPFDSVMLQNPERCYRTCFSRRNHYGVICK